MIMKKLVYTLILLMTSISLFAKTDSLKINLSKEVTLDSYTNEFLDTLEIKKKFFINDYSMIGVHYGVNLSSVLWNPVKDQKTLTLPTNIGITYTKYGKMFGYMPYFGFQIGLNFTQEGYMFDNDKEKLEEDMRRPETIEGADKVIYDVLELPMYFHFHYDLMNFKIIGNIGCYGAYRTGIHRYATMGTTITPGLERNFADYDRRWDYGIKGGVGFGLVFTPVEFHIMASYKYSFGTLHDPDHWDKTFYRYASPSNIIISAGLHFHLSKRTGKTKSELKQIAKDIVYQTNE